jgi:hypothetical protein
VNSVNFSRQEWEPSFNGDCVSKRFCPQNHWVNQKTQDGGCAQSWTLVPSLRHNDHDQSSGLTEIYVYVLRYRYGY